MSNAAFRRSIFVVLAFIILFTATFVRADDETSEGIKFGVAPSYLILKLDEGSSYSKTLKFISNCNKNSRKLEFEVVKPIYHHDQWVKIEDIN